MTGLNKVVVITGAAGGIGAAATAKYRMEGYTVIGLDQNCTSSKEHIVVCDIRDEDRVRECFETLKKIYGHIDYLINLAGVFYTGGRNTVEKTVLEHWEGTIRNNLTGIMLVTKYAIPLLRKAKGDKAIINISSDQAVFPRARNSAYAASKSGVESLTRSCALELIADRIRVNAIAPVSVRTGFIRELAGGGERMAVMLEEQDKRIPLGLIEPEDVAELIFFLGSSKATKITGQTIQMDGGLYTGGIF